MISNFSLNEPLENLVQIMTTASSALEAILYRMEALGFSVSHSYGLIKTGGVVVSCAWKKHWKKLPAAERARLKARQGVRTLAMAEVDVIDPEIGVIVKRDGITHGEIVLRGGYVMLGYLKDPEETSKCMKNGWFYTGYVAVMHHDGYLEIKDRLKDVIISGGENLNSVELDKVFATHSGLCLSTSTGSSRCGGGKYQLQSSWSSPDLRPFPDYQLFLLHNSCLLYNLCSVVIPKVLEHLTVLRGERRKMISWRKITKMEMMNH